MNYYHLTLAQANDAFEPFAKKHHPVPEFSHLGLFLIIFALIFLGVRRKMTRNKD